MKVNKKGHLYFNCATPVDGGCMTQSMSRHKAGDIALARHITKWDRPEERAEYLGAAALPAKAKPAKATASPAPAPAPKPKRAAPAPAPAPAARSGFSVNPMDRFR